MKAFAIFAAVAAVAGPAGAQVTGMDCRAGSSTISCAESAGSRAERMDRENSERHRKFMDDEPARPTVDIAALRRQRLQSKVAKLVKAGECDEARDLALEGGDMTMAEQAMRICRPTTPAAP